MDALNDLAFSVPQSWLTAISELLNDRGHDYDANAPSISNVTSAAEFQSVVNGLVRRAKGEPIIDSRAVGVPIID